jgi:hypothetical protein
MITIQRPMRTRTSKDAQMNPYFDVKDIPSLRADTLAPTGDRYIVHADTDKILGKIAKGYNISTHKEVDTMGRGFFDSLGIPYEVKSERVSNGGARFYQMITFPSLAFNPALAGASTALDNPGATTDTIFPAIRVGNSYNKTSPVVFDYGMFRFVCGNGMMLPAKGFQANRVSFRHNQIIDQDILQEAMLTKFEQSTKLIEVAYSTMNSTNGLDKLNAILNHKGLSDKFKSSLLDKLVGHVELDLDVKETKLDRGTKVEWAIKKVDTDASAWAIYNVATEISTHELVSQAERIKTDSVLAEAFLG